MGGGARRGGGGWERSGSVFAQINEYQITGDGISLSHSALTSLLNPETPYAVCVCVDANLILQNGSNHCRASLNVEVFVPGFQLDMYSDGMCNINAITYGIIFTSFLYHVD